MRTPMTASEASILMYKRMALRHAYGYMYKYRTERLLDIVNLRKRYNKKWQHQL